MYASLLAVFVPTFWASTLTLLMSIFGTTTNLLCSFGTDFRSLAVLLFAIGSDSAEQLGFEPHI